MIILPPLSLYIHIPWCVQKCPYCDFNSHATRGKPDFNNYVQHLLKDLATSLPLTNNRPLSTIFIGGGTPSLLPAEEIDTLLQGIRQQVEIVQNAEITLEANPGTIEAERFVGYQQAGVNRISIGIQSFQNNKLKALGRIHNAEEAKTAVKLAQSLDLRSLNLDLMHGLPQQTAAEALADLQQAIQLAPKHLSWYQLTIEPNTQFGYNPPSLPHEDILWDIYQQGHHLLTQAGYQQYETSAYAYSGYQCQHNLNYWRFGDYLAIGCGAHGKLSFTDGRILRTEKTRQPHHYMQRYTAKQYEVSEQERPFEFFMNRFRLIEATPRQEFTALTGLKEDSIRAQLDLALEQGYISESREYWLVSPKGQLFLNSLLELFLTD